ncbi:hypothetical protein Tco_1058166 [Tanacetum coccineum]|uniref:Uncharacterized protein n=1 Tax=Tanacetum coccineum TaxID=301880 RepID=A0ABQ5H877_9ASTR
MNAKLAWIHEKYNHRSETHIGGSSSQTHEIGDVYLTAEELHQLHLDEEALRETLEEQTMDEKAREVEEVSQKQADDEESFMEFLGADKNCSDSESSDNKLENYFRASKAALKENVFILIRLGFNVGHKNICRKLFWMGEDVILYSGALG